MPGFIDIASFPTNDGALHQVYANVHEETSSKLTLDFDHTHLRLLLRSLRSRNEEVKRRMGKLPYDVTLGVYNHPPVDGDSMGLAFVITEHIASCFGANQPRADGSLVLDDIPPIIATGDIDQSGIIHAVGAMEAKLTGILDAIESGSILPGGIFIYPTAAKSPGVSRLIRDLEEKGWTTLSVSHIDDVVPLWQPTPVPSREKPEQDAWARWKRPLALGAVLAITFTVIAILTADHRSPELPQIPPTPPEIVRSCAGLSGAELAQCLVKEQLGTRSGSTSADKTND